MLLEHPGEVVTREDVRKMLWPADTFVDFDHALNKAVNKIRDALGDSAQSPRFVETVARRGYRFLAEVQVADAELGAPLARAPPGSAAGPDLASPPSPWPSFHSRASPSMLLRITLPTA
jgi:DNA-binding winged helix-turn-helix (wHTH) protein